MSGTPVFHNLSDQPHIILVLQPLFEEANRVRRTLVQVCRHLGDANIGVAVPDLPAMGEHELSAENVSLAQMTDCVETLAATLTREGTPLISAGLRAGCLFDKIPSANAAWRFAPETGDRLVRTMMRTESPEDSDESHAFVQGQKVSRAFLSELSAIGLAELPKLRALRLATDRAPADLHVDASPLWRHAEPGEDAALAKLLANDLIEWVKTCAAS
jgi:hypothetical protein